jgi:uncharacterized membrane protein YhaH (DUF805 family)
MARNPRKKVVKVTPQQSAAGEGSGSAGATKPGWKPTPEAKAKATRLRWIAFALWLAAIGGEVFTILWILEQDPVKTWMLIAAIVVIGVLAVVGSLLWKRANDADPASKSQPVKFFIQNQLGAFVAIVAFLPLILVIFSSKNIDKGQKTIAGVAAIVMALVAVFFGMDFSPSSVEQYGVESTRIIELTGADEVAWVKSGSVYHICEDVPDVNLDSADGQIYVGTVGDAHAAGMEGLTLELSSELEACGHEVPENIDEILAAVRAERGLE